MPRFVAFCGGHRGRGFGPRFFLRSIFERLDTTPGQEKVIVQAVDELKGAFGGAKEKLKETRADFARVFRGEVVDEAALSDIFVKHDTLISETRRNAVEAVRKAHEALSEAQRGQVADFIERGRGGWGRGGSRHWMGGGEDHETTNPDGAVGGRYGGRIRVGLRAHARMPPRSRSRGREAHGGGLRERGEGGSPAVAS